MKEIYKGIFWDSDTFIIIYNNKGIRIDKHINKFKLIFNKLNNDDINYLISFDVLPVNFLGFKTYKELN